MNKALARTLKRDDKVTIRNCAGHLEEWTIDYIKVFPDSKVHIQDVDGSWCETEVKYLS